MRFFILSIGLFFVSIYAQGQSSWEQLANHPSTGIDRAFSFEIGGIVYVGTGRQPGGTSSSRVRAYDVQTDTWSTKANFPGGGRRNAFAFAVDGKGYVGNGFDGSSTLTDFWKYDPEEDTWTQLDDFPGSGRSHALALADSSKAYVLTGGADGVYRRDMWEFDPIEESWTALDNFPGIGRWRTFGWIIGQKLYAGGGARFPSSGLIDFYSYDIPTGTWTSSSLAVCPTFITSGGYSFAIQGKGYYVEGSDGLENTPTYGRKLFVYDPIIGTWEEDLEFIGPERTLGFSAVVGNKAIVGLGRQFLLNTYYRDVYSFTPEVISSTTDFTEAIDIQLYPNPVATSKLNIEGDFGVSEKITLKIIDAKGAVHYLNDSSIDVLGSGAIQLEVGHLVPGVYQLEINTGDQKRAVLRFVKQ